MLLQQNCMAQMDARMDFFLFTSTTKATVRPNWLGEEWDSLVPGSLPYMNFTINIMSINKKKTVIYNILHVIITLVRPNL